MAQAKKPKTGGRQKGSLNKSTIERLQSAERTVQQAKASGKKLAFEVLEDFMLLATGIAAAHQPLPPGAPPREGHRADEEKFWRAAEFARQCARDLIDFQTPRLKAVVHVDAGNAPGPQTASPKIIDLQAANDPGDIARAYRRMIAGSEA